MANVTYDQIANYKQDVETYQIMLMALVKKAGGSVSFTKAEIKDAYALMGELTEIGDKVIVKTVPRVNLDEQKAQEYFDEARRFAQGVSEVSRQG